MAAAWPSQPVVWRRWTTRPGGGGRARRAQGGAAVADFSVIGVQSPWWRTGGFGPCGPGSGVLGGLPRWPGAVSTVVAAAWAKSLPGVLRRTGGGGTSVPRTLLKALLKPLPSDLRSKGYDSLERLGANSVQSCFAWLLFPSPASAPHQHTKIFYRLPSPTRPLSRSSCFLSRSVTPAPLPPPSFPAAAPGAVPGEAALPADVRAPLPEVAKPSLVDASPGAANPSGTAWPPTPPPARPRCRPASHILPPPRCREAAAGRREPRRGQTLPVQPAAVTPASLSPSAFGFCPANAGFAVASPGHGAIVSLTAVAHAHAHAGRSRKKGRARGFGGRGHLGTRLTNSGNSMAQRDEVIRRTVYVSAAKRIAVHRPPELHFGATGYAEPVDIWSVGFIFAEFLLKKPLFPGTTKVSASDAVRSSIGFTCQ
ncbi:uncharacterized protein [Miscanthus floridulus]|uniref:uncharacterized protein n=1 Tax=Miscanthus floridulus TaxID=154761 RepID=UPI003459DC5A